MNIEQVKEALAEYDGTQYLIPRDAMQTVVEAARRFVDGWETCPTCNGKGAISEQAKGSLGGYRGRPCPDCVNGMIPGPQLVERGVDGACKHHTREQTKEMVKAVLLASRREEQ